jgi:hypothetical protein
MREGEDLVRLARRDPEAARVLLAREQRELADELERTFLAYEARLEALSRRVRSMEPATVRREMGILREAQDELRRVIRRASIAERQTRELQREWGEWKRLNVHSGLLESHALERLEMLRSELALRGVHLDALDPKQESQELPEARKIAEAMPATIVDTVEATEPDHLEEWDAILDQLSPPEVVQDIESARRMRDWAGERRRLDRRQGIRRDRLALLAHHQ